MESSPKQVRVAKKGLYIIYLASLLHLVGIISSLLRPKKDVPFNLTFHLLRFFSWWSVHASILTILATIIIGRQRKKTTSHFSQTITFLAVIYNLVTFSFLLVYFCMGKLKSYGFGLDLQLFTGHFAAPFLTIYYFYSLAPIDMLKKKLIKSFLLSFTCPVFYFFYVGTLAKINAGETSSLFPYMDRYPYFIFEWIVDRKGNLLILNFFLALLTFVVLCSLIIGTKIIYDRRKELFSKPKK